MHPTEDELRKTRIAKARKLGFPTMHPTETNTLETLLSVSISTHGLGATCKALAEACRWHGRQAAARGEPYQFRALMDAASWLDKTTDAATIRSGMAPVRIDVEA